MGLQPRGRSLTTTDTPPWSDPLDDIRASGTRLRVNLERRRYGKPVTVVDGFDPQTDLPAVARTLKQTLGAGGSAKDGRIEIQGDHTARLKVLLPGLGFALG